MPHSPASLHKDDLHDVMQHAQQIHQRLLLEELSYMMSIVDGFSIAGYVAALWTLEEWVTCHFEVVTNEVIVMLYMLMVSDYVDHSCCMQPLCEHIITL